MLAIRCPSGCLPATRFLIDVLLPGSGALKKWKACRNQEACGCFQASRRLNHHCAVVYLLYLGHLSFAAVSTRCPSSYFKPRAPTLYFPGISHQEMADANSIAVPAKRPLV